MWPYICDVTNILGCSRNEDCIGLSDTCTSESCMCGLSPMCDSSTSDTCESGTCKCGTNAECQGTFCVSGVCEGRSFSEWVGKMFLTINLVAIILFK